MGPSLGWATPVEGHRRRPATRRAGAMSPTRPQTVHGRHAAPMASRCPATSGGRPPPHRGLCPRVVTESIRPRVVAWRTPHHGARARSRPLQGLPRPPDGRGRRGLVGVEALVVDVLVAGASLVLGPGRRGAVAAHVFLGIAQGAAGVPLHDGVDAGGVSGRGQGRRAPSGTHR